MLHSVGHAQRCLGTLNLASKEHNAFIGQDLDFLEQVVAQVAVALDNAHAYREIAELKDKLTKEKLYLEDEIRSERNFEEIVGESAALKQVLNEAKTVAPSDATVLILGETGTGKELIARAIHRMSFRKNANFIKLNCAAIPDRTAGKRAIRAREGRVYRCRQPEDRASRIGR